MSPAVAEWLVNFGVAGIVIILLVAGELVPGRAYRKLEKALEDRERALETERQRNSELLLTAITGAKALTSLNQLAEERRAEIHQGEP